MFMIIRQSVGLYPIPILGCRNMYQISEKSVHVTPCYYKISSFASSSKILLKPSLKPKSTNPTTNLAQDLRGPGPGEELPRPGVLQEGGVRGEDGGRREVVSAVLRECPDGLLKDGGERSVAARYF